MKNIILLFPLLFALLSAANGQNVKYDVHEWGTFTTLCNSKGRQLTGLIVSEEAVPKFVHRYQTEWVTKKEDPGIKNGFIYTVKKIDFYNVNCRMETPVLYFYASNQYPFVLNKVRVDYEHGSVSEFYPNAKSEDFTNKGPMTLAGYQGFIEWNNVIVHATAADSLINTNKSEETEQWIAPRKTQARIIQVDRELEKFLFYRGIGYMENLFVPKFKNPGLMEIANWYSEDIPFFILFERDTAGKTFVYHTGRLNSHQVVNIKLRKTAYNIDQGKKELENALVISGLYRDEAIAMIETWKQSYFETVGMKALWILPKSVTNNTLRLSIDPPPASINGVLVGRTEILSPYQEAEIYNSFVKNKNLSDYAHDRFFHCYNDLLSDYVPNAIVTEDSACYTVNIYPNPTLSSAAVSVVKRCDEINEVIVIVCSTDGKSIFETNVKMDKNEKTIALPMAESPAGLYIVKVIIMNEIKIQKLVKSN